MSFAVTGVPSVRNASAIGIEALNGEACCVHICGWARLPPVPQVVPYDISVFLVLSLLPCLRLSFGDPVGSCTPG